jgi:hypothetical protein
LKDVDLIQHVRDATFREDSKRARTGNRPAVMATLQHFHRTSGDTNIARAIRCANRPGDLITAVTSSNPTMH